MPTSSDPLDSTGPSADAPTPPASRPSPPATASGGGVEDYRAASLEIESNLEVRRLMLVLANVLVPACAMGVTDCLGGSAWPPELAWLPANVLLLVGGTLTVVCCLVVVIVTRCHFGLVINGAKLRAAAAPEGSPPADVGGLNWLGLTTNFVALVAFSAGAGLAMLLAPLGAAAALAGLLGPVALGLLGLRVQHGRARGLVRRLAPNWGGGTVGGAEQEAHSRRSLDATTADTSVVVTMAAALFAGVFNAMTNVGGVNASLDLPIPVVDIHRYGVAVLSGWLTIALLLSSRMVVRLRLALAEHSADLAALRDEPDDPWRFRVTERTFVLFALVQMLAAVSAVVFVWGVAGALSAAIAGALIGLGGGVAYALILGKERRRRSPAS